MPLEHTWMGAQRLLAHLLLVILLAGRAASAQPEGKVLRLGYFPNLTHAQALYARSTGAFEKVGARIQWAAFNAGPTAIEALFTDAVDATFVGPSPTINGYIKSKGDKFVVVAGSASGGAGLVVRGDSGITTAKDFGGKVIATPQLGNTQDIAARVWLSEQGYRLRERGGNVALVALSNADQLTMFKKREIDGAWTVEPWLARLEVEGGGTVFLEEKSLWPGGRYSTTHLIVNKVFPIGDRRRLDGRTLAGPAGSGGRRHRVPGGEIALARRQILDDAPDREQGVSGRQPEAHQEPHHRSRRSHQSHQRG